MGSGSPSPTDGMARSKAAELSSASFCAASSTTFPLSRIEPAPTISQARLTRVSSEILRSASGFGLRPCSHDPIVRLGIPVRSASWLSPPTSCAAVRIRSAKFDMPHYGNLLLDYSSKLPYL
ncbi:protein of unknown function [Nitratireductor aquimarinus]